MYKGILIIFVSLLFAGCVSVATDTGLIDDISAPVFELDSELSVTDRDAEWWTRFEDAELNHLVETALNNNPDLEIARANVAAAYAVFRDINNDDRVVGDVALVYSNQDQVLPGFTSERTSIDSYQLGSRLSWNLDLFGRIEYATQAALADAEARYLAWRDFQVGLTAQVATTYAEYKGAIARHEFASRNLDTLRQTRSVVADRAELGFSSDLDLLRVESQVKELESQLPALNILATTARNSLAALTGQSPGEFQLTNSYQEFPGLNQPTAIGDPSALLSRRADLRLAERAVAAASALTRSQRAALYPDISITGFLGFLAPGFSGLDGGNEAWSMAPSLSWPAFDLVSVEARIDIAAADEAAALANFEATLLAVLAEAQNALDTYALVQQQLNLLAEQVIASEQALEIAQLQFDAGVIDLLDLLDVERSLINAQDNLELTKAETFKRLVELYRSFGGGLSEAELSPEPVAVAEL